MSSTTTPGMSAYGAYGAILLPPEPNVGGAKVLGRASASGHVTVGDDIESAEIVSVGATGRRRLTGEVWSVQRRRRRRGSCPTLSQDFRATPTVT